MEKERLEKFFKYRPGMRRIVEYPGTFGDYAAKTGQRVSESENSDSGYLKESPNHKLAICGLSEQEARRILGDKIQPGSIETQLKTSRMISYADHHGLLNYSLLYNSNILYGEVIKKLEQPQVVVFASGSVPMINRSHPRGFYFKGEKFNFFPERKAKMPVCLCDKTIRADRAKGLDSVISSYNKNLVTGEEKKFLECLFFDGLGIENIDDPHLSFADQLTVLNHKLWTFYFDQTLRDSIPEMIYLQSNPIIREMLVQDIERKDSLISSILFDPDVRQCFLRNFFGIPCCWGDHMGSELFWGISDKKKMRRLELDNSSGTLSGDNIHIELQKDSLIDALKNQHILPTLFIDFLYITFLGGYTALGGFNQIDYLPRMQTAYVKTLRELGMDKLADRFASRVTDGFICGMFPFQFDSGIDLIWHYNSQNGKFNGNLDRGLTQDDLDRVLNMKVRDMVLPAIETMLENI